MLRLTGLRNDVILKGLLNIKILIIFTIVCSVFLFVGGPDYYSPRSFKYFWDIGHIVFFSALSTLILLRWSTHKKMSFLRQCVILVLVTIILGILIEWIQAGAKRTVDILDVVRNLIGTLVAISFLAPANKTVPKLYLGTLRFLAILMVIWAVLPLAKAVADEVLARIQFPVLSDFETPFEINRWSGKANLSIDNEVHFHGRSSLKVALKTSNYSGAGLRYFPRNWSNYKYLHLHVFNPTDDSLKIKCRIHDRRHAEGNQAYGDRFNKSYVLEQGWNRIVIPLEQVENAPKTRKLDLKRVQKLSVYVYRLSHPRVIYIDKVSLTNSADMK